MNRKTTVIPQDQVEAQLALCSQVQAYWHGQGRTPTAYVETYGCQQNEADSQRIRGLLAACGYGFGQGPEGADLVVMNTCAIREHAEQRVFGNLGALTHTKRRHPAQKIFLCGCMAGQPEVEERLRKSFPHVDGVFSTHHLWQFPEILLRVLTTGKRVYYTQDEPGSIAEGLPVRREGHLKAWVSIMYGCNNFCSYCIVPYVRGRERSRRPEAILAECRELIESGYKDITLLGQNVNSYGKDLDEPMDFADLLKAASELPGDFLLRFMTSHPKDASQKLFDTMASSPKIAPCFHLPFQAGNDRILKAMNRVYDRAGYLDKVRRLRQAIPDVVITSDVIVGFPGETAEEFEDTMTLIDEVRFDALFTFIFSPREGTPAAKMDDPIPKAEKAAHFQRLVERQDQISEEKHAAYIGKTVRCLVDGKDDKGLTARTPGNRLVRLTGGEGLIGQFVDVKITGANKWSLSGEPA